MIFNWDIVKTTEDDILRNICTQTVETGSGNFASTTTSDKHDLTHQNLWSELHIVAGNHGDACDSILDKHQFVKGRGKENASIRCRKRVIAMHATTMGSLARKSRRRGRQASGKQWLQLVARITE